MNEPDPTSTTEQSGPLDPGPEPEPDIVAMGAVQLSEVLAEADREGFVAEFRVADDPAADDLLHCPSCGRDVAASDVARVWSRRLEGASDPADMLHVSALRCPECGGSAVFVSPYGPSASAREGSVLRALPDPERSAK